MDGVRYEEFSLQYLKVLGEGERQGLLSFLYSLSDTDAQLVIDTGKQFHKSSAVNSTWFWRTVTVSADELQPVDFKIWLEEGTRISRGSWESTLSFLKASPKALKICDSAVFLNWLRIGSTLVRFSNHDTNWYFKNSADLLEKMDRVGQKLLTTRILGVIDRSWQTAVACMKAWPEITRSLPKDNWEIVLTLGFELAADYPDDAEAFFQTVPAFLRAVDSRYLGEWVHACYHLKKIKRGPAGAYFRATPGLLEKTEQAGLIERLNQWALWGERLASIDGKVAEAFFEKTPLVLKYLDWSLVEDWITLVEHVKDEYSVLGCLEFLKTTPQLLPQLDIVEIAEWVRHGLGNIKGHNRIAYFTLKSQESRDTISKLRTGLHLETVKKVLLLYSEGLTGEQVFLRNTSQLPSKIHNDDKVFGTLDTRRIYLPDMLKEYHEDHDNFRFYRVMMMHLMAHRQFGSLNLSLAEFREMASNRLLGLLFEYIEDNRVDYMAINSYPGLGRDIKHVLQSEADESKDSFGSLVYYLKQYLWSETTIVEVMIAPEVKAEIQDFWCQVVENGASARESLKLARSLLHATFNKDITEQQVSKLKNHKFRGKLCYDLIYTAAKLDEELDEDRKSDKVPAMDNPSADPSINLRSDFYLYLEKLLTQFIEDEENPYRMIVFYDEWDRTLNDYKKDWCRVREILLKPSTGLMVTRTLEENHGMINTLKRYFGMLRPDRFRRYGRQEDGEDIDIDAVIDAMVEKEAGVSPTGGFYIRRDKRERDVAVGFLLDLSYSTEEIVPGTGKTLLDVEIESVIVMSEALEVLGDKYAIYGFNSDSRDKINFYVVKDFEETYTLEVKQRYGGLQSHGMTRLAAAVRHAVFKLERIQAAIKILIVLSDGRPFDFDYNSGLTKEHEEFYAEADTRVALREAKMKGINPFCITVDNKGKDYMDYIFGNVSYIIIDDVNALPTKLTETYKNLTT